MINDTIVSVEIELDTSLGYAMASVPFYVKEIITSTRPFKEPLKGIIKLEIFLSTLDLTQVEAYLQRPKSLVLKITPDGKKPLGFNWQCIRTSSGLRKINLIWATLI